MNEVNPGLGFEHQLSDTSKAIGGFYRNTEGRNSMYGGVNYSPVSVGPVQLGANLGLLSGYSAAPVIPMIAPTASLEGKDYGLNLTFMPNPKDWKTSAVGLQVKRRVKKDPPGLLYISRKTSYGEDE